MTDHGCWRSEYDWEVSRRSDSQSRETVLSVLFDSGAQRRFSSVRVALRSSDVGVTEEHRTAWRITLHPSSSLSSSSVDSHVSAQDGPATHSDHSLPVFHVVFVADQHSARSQTTAQVARLCGELVLTEPGSPSCFGTKLFEVDQPLDENTQSVSVSFTSSRLLSTTVPRGVFPEPWIEQPATVGRVVRVVPVDGERRTIPLPTDVLLIVFENLRSPCRGWRRGLLNAALVCREWTCALRTLLIDFRSQVNQQCHPPEIANFASGLVARPSLGLEIKYLSAGYLERHPTWDPFPVHPPGNPTPMFLAKLRLQQTSLRRSRFASTFLSILHIARNVETLSLDTAIPLVAPPDDVVSALSGLDRLEAFLGKCPLTMAQLLPCVAAWSSLKRLTILSALLPGTGTSMPAPTSGAPPKHLTEVVLVGVPIQDDELAWLVSGGTLERLTLQSVTHLTNAGLGAVLSAVAKSLQHLSVVTSALVRAPGEEHAVDVMVGRMGRLTGLEIDREVASERLLEGVGQQRTSEIDLTLAGDWTTEFSGWKGRVVRRLLT